MARETNGTPPPAVRELFKPAYRRKTVLLFIGTFGYILAAWCWLGGLAFGVIIWLTHSWWSTFLAFGTMTFFFYCAYAVMFTFIAENFPAELRATAASFANSLAVELGLGLGPFGLSWAVGSVGWEAAFTWCAVVPVILAGVTFLGLKPVPREAVI